MALVYFESSQLVLVVEKSCVGIVGKIGKSIGKHGFSADSDAVWMVFVQRALAADTFADFFSSTNINFHHQLFLHRKDMIKSNGLKYFRTNSFLLDLIFSITLSSGVGIPTHSDEFRRIPMDFPMVFRLSDTIPSRTVNIFSSGSISNHWILS